jgi:type IV secretion system protein TrbJ
MKKLQQLISIGLFSMLVFAMPARAQIPTTDIANLVQQTLQYTQQIEQYTRQGLQLEAELKNLVQNPTSLLGEDIGRMINGIGSIMSGTNSIGGNLASIDRNFANTFKNPNYGTMSSNFTKWNSASTGTLEAALKSAGLHRDQFSTDTAALKALYNESQAAGGNLQAVQSMAKINAMQVQQTQKLQDLVSTQNIANSTFMAAQTAKENATNDNSEAMKNSFLSAKPTTAATIDTSARTYKKWDFYTTK